MNPQFSNAISDPARLDELIRLRLLDSPPEAPFDRLTRLAARTLGAPISLVSLVDDHRQFFKSAFGLPEPWSTMRETPLSHSFCQHVVLRGVPLVVENAPDDPIVAGNPAISLLNVIAYLGVPLTTATGKTLGSFCVIAHHPVKWSACDRETMVELAASVMSEIALRFTHDELSQANAGLLQEAARREIAIGELRQSEARLRTAQRLARVGSFELRANASPGSYWSDEARRILGLTREPPDSVAQFVARHVHPEDRCRVESAVAQAFSSRQTAEVRRIRFDFGMIWQVLKKPHTSAGGSRRAIGP